MTWNKLSKRQQDTARRISASIPHTQVPQASVSQVAKYLDDAMAYHRGEITLAQLCERTGWTYTAPERKATVREMAAELGVSLSTIYRRCRDGLLNAAKDATGRWVITVTA